MKHIFGIDLRWEAIDDNLPNCKFGYIQSGIANAATGKAETGYNKLFRQVINLCTYTIPY